MNLNIRQEQPADYPVVFKIIEQAFRTMPFADGNEQFLAETLRKSKAFIPEFKSEIFMLSYEQ
jgi:predicted N-acetyltransferase YhbS